MFHRWIDYELMQIAINYRKNNNKDAVTNYLQQKGSNDQTKLTNIMKQMMQFKETGSKMYSLVKSS